MENLKTFLISADSSSHYSCAIVFLVLIQVEIAGPLSEIDLDFPDVTFGKGRRFVWFFSFHLPVLAARHVVDPFIMLCCDGHFLHGLWPPSNSLGFVEFVTFLWCLFNWIFCDCCVGCYRESLQSQLVKKGAQSPGGLILSLVGKVSCWQTRLVWWMSFISPMRVMFQWVMVHCMKKEHGNSAPWEHNLHGVWNEPRIDMFDFCWDAHT